MRLIKLFARYLALCAIVIGSLVTGEISLVRAAEVYKHVDAQGHVTYSDHPTSAASEKIEVQVPAANAAEAERLSKEQAMFAVDEKRRAAVKDQQQRADAAKETEQSKRAKRCDEARSRYSKLMTHTRIYTEDDKGTRDYYSSNEIDAQRASAKATMDSECGG